ncbi:MAG: ribosome maturation factor RimM [Candidatus Zhuqueibacterota bacterium]
MKKRPDFISIGVISNAHGIKGEMVVKPFTDELQQFEKRHEVFVTRPGGQRETMTSETGKVLKDKVIVRFAGITTRDEALALKGAFIEKRIQDCESLPSDEFYIFDLIGLEVYTTQDKYLGELADVLTLTANDVYVVHNGENELLIPAIKDVVKSIDLRRGVVIIEPIDGLL